MCMSIHSTGTSASCATELCIQVSIQPKRYNSKGPDNKTACILCACMHTTGHHPVLCSTYHWIMGCRQLLSAPRKKNNGM